VHFPSTSKVMIEFCPCPTHLMWRNSPKEITSPLNKNSTPSCQYSLFDNPTKSRKKKGDAMENMLGNTLGTRRTYWRTDENPTGNLKGTVETHWEPGKSEKKKSSSRTPPPPKLKRKKKKARHVECMHGPSHWLQEISLPKRVGHYFWPELVPPCKEEHPTGGTYFYLFCFILISWGCLTSFFFFFFFFWQWANLIGPSQKKKKKRS
jgi:hypothetical protein